MKGMDFSGKSGKEGWTNIVHPLARLGGARFCSRFEARFIRKPFRYKLQFFKYVIFPRKSMILLYYFGYNKRLHEISGLAHSTHPRYG